MSQFKLISFDIWGTLLKSNPEFVAARNTLFAEYLDHTDHVYVKRIKDETDIKFDLLSESTGNDFDFFVRLEHMLQQTGKKPGHYSDKELEVCRQKLNQLALQYLPSLIEESTLSLLDTLRNKGFSVALLSNTGFLHGDIMRDALRNIGVLQDADYTLFSNEIGYAKPHTKIYAELARVSGIPTHQILHIGDSVNADYHGAWTSGITSILYDKHHVHGNRMFSIPKLSSILDIIEMNTPIVHYRNMSLHQLHIENKHLIDQSGQQFDLATYSKFKYGDGLVAKTYGHQLAKQFIATYPDVLKSDTKDLDIVITTSPYKSIVKGSSGIVRGFKNYLNQYLVSNGMSPVVDIIILKQEMFQGDYGSFSDEERKKLMQKNDLHIMEKFIVGKKLILIDDARITGSHEANLISFLANKNIKEAFFLYVADMDTAFAKEHPDIESEMNHGWVDRLNKLPEIMNSTEFILNARVCKYILGNSNATELRGFLEQLNDTTLYNVYNGIIADGYSTMDAYKQSFGIVEEAFRQRGLMD